MSRQEEIKAEALSVKGVPEDYSMIDCFRLGFQEGAKWADRTMIEKAIKWIEENIDLVAMDTVSAKSGYHQIVMMQDFKQKFREAMQE